MRTEWLKRCGAVAVAGLLAVAVTGCGDDDATDDDDATTAQASVKLQATMASPPGGGSISAVTVKVLGPNNTLDLPKSVTVKLKPPVSAEQNLTPALKKDSPTQIRLDAFPVTENGVYRLTFTGPEGAVVLTNANDTPASVKLGTVEFAFQRLADGTIVVPSSATVSIPARGVTTGDGASFTGLPAGAKVHAVLRTNTGTQLKATRIMPRGQKTLAITDFSQGVDAAAVNGTRSLLLVETTR